DARYALTALARRSPSARLYSAVPRSSQCPSTVIAHVEYFFSTSASAVATARPVSSSSALSSGKKIGFSGELRFKSSSDRLATESSPRRGATGTESSTRWGGAGRGGSSAGASVTVGVGCGVAAGFLLRE